jgi:hypothetical protein
MNRLTRWLRTSGPVVGLCLVQAAPAAGQLIRPQIGLAAGMAFPTGDYGGSGGQEGFSPALQGTGFLFLRLRSIPVELRMAASYTSNGANDRLNADLLAVFGLAAAPSEQTKLVGGTLDGLYTLPFRVLHLSPYVLAGGGIYRTTLSVTAFGMTGTTVNNRFAWNAGGGVSLSLRKFSVFLEAKQVGTGTASGLPKITLVPVLIGIRFGGS